MNRLLQFLQDVNREREKVVWPSRRETLITTGLVIAMAVFASLFFLLADRAIEILVGIALGIGRVH